MPFKNPYAKYKRPTNTFGLANWVDKNYGDFFTAGMSLLTNNNPFVMAMLKKTNNNERGGQGKIRSNVPEKLTLNIDLKKNLVPTAPERIDSPYGQRNPTSTVKELRRVQELLHRQLSVLLRVERKLDKENVSLDHIINEKDSEITRDEKLGADRKNEFVTEHEQTHKGHNLIPGHGQRSDEEETPDKPKSAIKKISKWLPVIGPAISPIIKTLTKAAPAFLPAAVIAGITEHVYSVIRDYKDVQGKEGELRHKPQESMSQEEKTRTDIITAVASFSSFAGKWLDIANKMGMGPSDEKRKDLGKTIETFIVSAGSLGMIKNPDAVFGKGNILGTPGENTVAFNDMDIEGDKSKETSKQNEETKKKVADIFGNARKKQNESMGGPPKVLDSSPPNMPPPKAADIAKTVEHIHQNPTIPQYAPTISHAEVEKVPQDQKDRGSVPAPPSTGIEKMPKEHSDLGSLSNTVFPKAPLPKTGEIEPDPKKTQAHSVFEGFISSGNPKLDMTMKAIARQEGNGYKNNNPGNLMDFQYFKKTGGKFRIKVFDTIQNGWVELKKTLKGKLYFGDTKKSLYDIFNTYAPAGHGNNDPLTYAKNVGQALGIDPFEPGAASKIFAQGSSQSSLQPETNKTVSQFVPKSDADAVALNKKSSEITSTPMASTKPIIIQAPQAPATKIVSNVSGGGSESGSLRNSEDTHREANLRTWRST